MPSAVLTSVRTRRIQLGLAQSQLAHQVGVSRQGLVAIEAGRQVPSTRLALQLARALRCSVDELFALADDARLAVRLASDDPPPCRRVAVGRVDGSWVAHPVADEARPGDAVVVGRCDARSGTLVEPLVAPTTLEHNVLIAGCAPLLGVLAGGVEHQRPDARATWVPANSTRALELLAQGLVHVAGLHLVDADADGGHTPLVRARFPDRTTTVLSLTRWRQGLVVAAGNPRGIRSVCDLLRADVEVAGREPGAGADALLRRCLEAMGSDDERPATHRASGHADVARLVRWGVCDVGIAIESAALAHGLDFIPLAEERFDLVVPRSRLDTPAVARLLGQLEARWFRTEAARLPGYDVSTAGQAVTVRAGEHPCPG